MILDRLATDSIAMTDEFVSNMLGVRRESVSVAAHVLQLEGAIQYGVDILRCEPQSDGRPGQRRLRSTEKGIRPLAAE